MSFNPYLEVIIAAVIFGTAGIFVKIIDLPTTTITFFRTGVPTLLLFVYFVYKRKNIIKLASKPLIFVSILNAIRLFLWLFAYLHTSVGNAVIILYTWPIFTVLLSPVLLKEKLTEKKLFLSLLAFLGIVIIFSSQKFSFQNEDFLGMSSMLAAAFLGALTTILYKKQLSNYSTSEMIFYQNVMGSVLFMPLLLINSSLLTISKTAITTVYSIIIGLVAYIFWFSGLRKMRASTLSILTYSEVVSAIILGVLVLNETLTWNMIVGGGIILIVSYLARNIEKV